MPILWAVILAALTYSWGHLAESFGAMFVGMGIATVFSLLLLARVSAKADAVAAMLASSTAFMTVAVLWFLTVGWAAQTVSLQQWLTVTAVGVLASMAAGLGVSYVTSRKTR